MNVTPRRANDLYEVDEHSWIDQQVKALRDGRLADLDRPHLSEYLTDMAGRDYNQLESRLVKLFAHLLKIEFQQDRMTVSWVNTVKAQQASLKRLLRRFPSMDAKKDTEAVGAYQDAVQLAATETRLPVETFPALSPWTVEQALTYECPEVPPTPSYRWKSG